MPKLSIHIGKAASAAGAWLLFCAGCMSYRTGDVIRPEPPSTWPSAESGRKPVVFMQTQVVTQTFNESSPRKNLFANQWFRGFLCEVFNAGRVFESYTFLPDRATNVDYRIALSMTCKEKGSIVNMVAAMVTLTVVPGVSTERYELAANVFDSSGKILKRYEVAQSVQNWIAIWCLPLGTARSIDKIRRQTQTDMVHSILAQMKEDGLMRVPAASAKAGRKAKSAPQ